MVVSLFIVLEALSGSRGGGFVTCVLGVLLVNRLIVGEWQVVGEVSSGGWTAGDPNGELDTRVLT